MTKCSIYLAGKIKKAHENDNEAYWTQQDLAAIRNHLQPIEVNLLNPAIRSDNLNDQRSVFGRDLMMVYSAHAVWVDARDRRGLGVGAEMMWAKVHSKPVIVLAPQETFYRKSTTKLLGKPVNDYVHPFVDQLADVIVDSIEQGCEWLSRYHQSPDDFTIKNLTDCHQTMQYYVQTQFEHDVPMQQMVNECSHLASIQEKIMERTR